MKIHLNQKSIFKYLYYLLTVTCLFLLYLVFNFGKIQVYDTIYTSDYISLLQNKKYITALNIASFNEIIEKLKKKSSLPEVKNPESVSSSSLKILN